MSYSIPDIAQAVNVGLITSGEGSQAVRALLGNAIGPAEIPSNHTVVRNAIIDFEAQEVRVPEGNTADIGDNTILERTKPTPPPEVTLEAGEVGVGELASSAEDSNPSDLPEPISPSSEASASADSSEIVELK